MLARYVPLNTYRKGPLISPGLIQLRTGVEMDIETGGLYRGGGGGGLQQPELKNNRFETSYSCTC